LCKIAGCNEILIYFLIERPWTGSITRGPDPSTWWMYAEVRPARRYDSSAVTMGSQGGGDGRGGAVLVLTGEREATETAGDERDREAVVAIGVERLRAWR
jgi:hypothetical protein